MPFEVRISPTTFTKVLRGNPNKVTFDIGCSNAAAELRSYGDLTFRQSPWPGERAKCSAWAVCLGYRATAIEPDETHLMQKQARVNNVLVKRHCPYGFESDRQATFGGNHVSSGGMAELMPI